MTQLLLSAVPISHGKFSEVKEKSGRSQGEVREKSGRSQGK